MRSRFCGHTHNAVDQPEKKSHYSGAHPPRRVRQPLNKTSTATRIWAGTNAILEMRRISRRLVNFAQCPQPNTRILELNIVVKASFVQ